MRLVGKVGASLLSLLLFAAPIMACALPAMAMSAEERECCRRMAQECGNNGMAKSHSCCQTVSVRDHLPAIKSAAADASATSGNRNNPGIWFIPLGR
jgi:hypothetical protein